MNGGEAHKVSLTAELLDTIDSKIDKLEASLTPVLKNIPTQAKPEESDLTPMTSRLSKISLKLDSLLERIDL